MILRPLGTALASVVVLAALLLPADLALVTPAAFARVPVELLAGLALLLVLRGRARRVAAVLGGVAVGLLVVLKLLDAGFRAALARPFDPVLDWRLLDDAAAFVEGSAGALAAAGAVVAVVVAVLGVLAAGVLAVRALGRATTAHPRRSAVLLAAGAVVWVVCALLGAALVPGLPVADRGSSTLLADRAVLVGDRLRDGEVFAAQLAADAFRDTPGEQLLTGLRGKDVVVAFVESYGRDAVQDPELSVATTLADGDRTLAAAGFAARSGYLTSSTAGGASWLAHATLLSGTWVDNQQRYDTLLAGERLNLPRAFAKAGWRTVGVMPNTTMPWPQGQAFYGYDRLYDFAGLGYRGPSFSWSAMPDQYTLAAFERFERAADGPVMAEIALVSSHAPWAPRPRLVGWDQVGDGSVFDTMAAPGDDTDVILTRDPVRVRADYRAAVEYSLSTLVSYVQTHGDDDLVLVLLGDHQPAPVVTGEGASRDVPVTVVARDPAVLDSIAGWGWTPSMRPAPDAPVWPMDAFRDRFLTAFGPGPRSR
ncbi:MAG: sulfatase-like hydrolase/transferase [Pseudonocardia sp.]